MPAGGIGWQAVLNTVAAQQLECTTEGRGLYRLDQRVDQLLPSGFNGLCHLFIRHTSASLVITENADPEVHRDLERFFADLVPDGSPLFRHIAEGEDDMPAHVRSLLTQSELLLPVREGRLALGNWQGVYVWEHRTVGHCRSIVMSLLNTQC